MVTIGNRIMKLLIIISMFILINLSYFVFAKPVNNTKIIIDENLKIGMPLKDAIDLLGSPERIQVTKSGTVLLPYNTLGLSIEVESDGTIIEGIHLLSSFRGQFASGLEIGVDFQKILSVYNQPDIMTKEIIEYSDIGRIFQIHQGRLVGADLYSDKSTLYRQVSSKETGEYEEVHEEAHEVAREELREEVREEVRKEVREEVREEVRKEVREEVHEEVREELRVFDIFGFKVKNAYKGVVITEIRPGSVAEYGGLKVGERIRKASLKGYGVRNIYSVGGLKDILRKAIYERKKTINILQDKRYYYKVKVPKRRRY